MISIEQNGTVNIEEVLSHTTYAGSEFAKAEMRACLRRSSHHWVGSVDGEVGCVFGVITGSIFSEVAYIWLLTTDVADKHKFTLIRQSQIWIKVLLEQYRALSGHCLLTETQSIKWMKLLGAEFGEYSGTTIPFWIRRKDD